MNEAAEPAADASVSLREITKDTVGQVLRLKVADGQEQFVAPNAVSLAEALFHEEAWYRAIYADEVPVGFVMLAVEPEKANYHLWRFLVDARYQGRGYGARALEHVIEHVKGLPNASELKLSFIEAEGSPEGFYQRLGFERTGEIDEGEQVMRLGLS